MSRSAVRTAVRSAVRIVVVVASSQMTATPACTEDARAAVRGLGPGDGRGPVVVLRPALRLVLARSRSGAHLARRGEDARTMSVEVSPKGEGVPDLSGKTLAKWRRARCVELALAGHSSTRSPWRLAIRAGERRGERYRTLSTPGSPRRSRSTASARTLGRDSSGALAAGDRWLGQSGRSDPARDRQAHELLGLDSLTCRATGRGPRRHAPEDDEAGSSVAGPPRRCRRAQSGNQEGNRARSRRPDEHERVMLMVTIIAVPFGVASGR